MKVKQGMWSTPASAEFQPNGHIFRAHAAIASILKRLAHRNPNVQLYALSLAESLSKNLGIEIHRELASRAFTQGLEKLITDRVRNIMLNF